MASIPLKIERDGETYYLIFGPEEGRSQLEAERYVTEIEEAFRIEGAIIEEIDDRYQVYGTVQIIDQIVERERKKLGIDMTE